MGTAPQNTGRMLRQYRLLEPLGRGGMGVVYLAEDTRLGRKVALKLLPPDTPADATRSLRFEEARAAATLTHPAIAAVYELGESEGEGFIAIEYVRATRCVSRLAGAEPWGSSQCCLHADRVDGLGR